MKGTNHSNEESDDNCAIADERVLHPCCTDCHSTIKILTSRKNTDKKLNVFAHHRWRFGGLQVWHHYRILGVGEPIHSHPHWLYVTIDPYSVHRPWLHALEKDVVLL